MIKKHADSYRVHLHPISQSSATQDLYNSDSPRDYIDHAQVYKGNFEKKQLLSVLHNAAMIHMMQVDLP